MSTNHKKELLWGLIFFVLVFVSFGGFYDFTNSYFKNNRLSTVATIVESIVPVEEKIIREEKVENIKLALVGDIMFDRGVKTSVYKNFAGNYSALFSKVADKLKVYDLLVANLEGPISDKGTDIGGLYSFRFEPKIVTILKEAGFDVLSVANNHTYNWGQIALVDTLENLSDAGIIYFGGGYNGSEAYQEKAVDIQGVKIAFLAFNEFKAGGINSSSTSPGLAMISEKEVSEKVSFAKDVSDLVVVSFHFGEEYKTEPNSYQRKYAELAINSGADLVIGHHPHTVQTLEQYKNAYIIYSLGNFIFDQYFSPETMQGGLLEVEVSSINKMIEKVILRKVFLNKLYQLESIE